MTESFNMRLFKRTLQDATLWDLERVAPMLQARAALMGSPVWGDVESLRLFIDGLQRRLDELEGESS